MYKGPYLFDLGASTRWLFLFLFSQKHRNERGLFKKVLSGGRSLGERAWEIFALHFFIGVIVVFLMITVIVYLGK